MPAADIITTRNAQYSLIEVALPGREQTVAGVLLYDPEERRLEMRLRRDWSQIAEPDDAEVLSLVEDDLRAQLSEVGPEQFLARLEDTLSNVLRISARQSVLMADFESTLARIYRQNVQPTVLRFRTHLPLYSCRAAAGRFGDLMAVEEQGWVEAPANLRLTEDMFVAQVVGKSMEPRIPDGSYCVFRHNLVGSREGKLVLVENLAESAEGGERYTVKRYRSLKRPVEGGWEHAWVKLEPLNPEFEAWEILEGHQCRVLAEFIRVLGSAGAYTDV